MKKMNKERKGEPKVVCEFDTKIGYEKLKIITDYFNDGKRCLD